MYEGEHYKSLFAHIRNSPVPLMSQALPTEQSLPPCPRLLLLPECLREQVRILQLLWPWPPVRNKLPGSWPQPTGTQRWRATGGQWAALCPFMPRAKQSLRALDSLWPRHVLPKDTMTLSL